MASSHEIQGECTMERDLSAIEACGKQTAKPGRNAAQTRFRILQNAECLFTRYPYELVTLRRIAEMSGINVALIARYYGSKKELFSAVLDSLSARRPPLCPEDKLGDLAGRIVRSLEKGPDDDIQLSILNILMLSSQSREAMPVIQERVKGFFTDMAKTEGEDAVPAGYMLTSCVLGVLLLRRLLPEDYPMTASSSDMLKALRILRNALAVSEPEGSD